MSEEDFSDVRVGVVGLGGIGRTHAERLASLGADIVGGVDVDAEARESFGSAYDCATHEDPDALYAEADAVLVTTPNRFHEEYAVSALEAGVHVLLEKPLAHTLTAAEHIAETARDSTAFCMVGFNNRYAAPVEVLASELDAGRFGDVTHVEANYVRRRGVPGRGSWFTSKDVAGGGALIDIGVHAVDLALHFLDFPDIVEVSGVTRSEFGGREDYGYLHMWGDDQGPEGFDVDDSASAFIRGANGETISLECAWATNRPPENEFVIRGTEAGATFDRETGELTVHETGTAGVDHFADTDVETGDRDTYEAEQAAFLQGVREDEAPDRNTVEQGLAVQRVLDAIYRSSEAGEAVRLDA